MKPKPTNSDFELRAHSTPSKTRLDVALEGLPDTIEEEDFLSQIRMFFNKYLVEMIDIQKDSNVLSQEEEKSMRLLYRLMDEGTMEDVRDYGSNGYQFFGGGGC